MRLTQWQLRFDAELKRRFGITSDDAGLDARDILRWRRGFNDDPEDAALSFGDKYDLIDLDGPWMRP